MKTKTKSLLGALTLLNSLVSLVAQPTPFNYQGFLTDRITGNPLNGSYDFNFTNYDAATPGANAVAWDSAVAVGVTNGLFSVAVDFGPGVFTGPDRWLEVSVRTNGVGPFDTVSPRKKILSAPYAIFANAATKLAGMLPATQLTGTLPAGVLVDANGGGLTNLDGSALASGSVPDERLAANVARTNQVWLLSGNGGTTAGAQFLGTTDGQPLELKVGGIRVLRFEPAGNDSDDPGTDPDGAPNIISGAENNYVAPGVVGATIAGGGATNFAAPGLFWGSNSVFSHYATIGGGRVNTIGTNSTDATIGGGEWNEILANSHHATIGGGRWHMITNSPYATIAGGDQHRVSAEHATIAGGEENVIEAGSSHANIVAGYRNWIRTNAIAAHIAGGGFNQIGNASSGATIGGGDMNLIGTNAYRATISGGWGNSILNNAIYATIPGGASNSAASYAFAAGRGARAIHQGAFVWADSVGKPDFTPLDFTSTASNQFLIRAAGGVGINMNSPTNALVVNGTASATAFQGDGAGLTGLNAANISGGTLNSLRLPANLALLDTAQTLTAAKTFSPGVQLFLDAGGPALPGLTFNGDGDTGLFHPLVNTVALATSGSERIRVNSAGNVGIGTTSPSAKLHVNGNVYVDGDVTITGTVNPPSDRNVKQDFAPVQPRAVLEKLAALTIQTWAYRNSPVTRHLGPVAQDFHSAFGLGADDKHIATVDADGVALAAIQGLDEIVKEKDAKIGELEKRLAALEQTVQKLISKGK